MKLSTNDLTLIAVLAVNGPDGRALAVASLAKFFDRPCKLRRAIDSGERWGLLVHDPYKNQVRLLVQPTLRALCAGPVATEREMFPDERPLDAPLAAVCAEPPSPPSARSTFDRVPVHEERVPEHAPCVPAHADSRPETAPRNPSVPRATSTFNRKNVSTLKRLTCSVEDLQTKVRLFVGEDDFELHWRAAKFWDDEHRSAILEGTLRYLMAGIRAKELSTKKTPGKHLWFLFRNECQKQGISALV